MPGIYILHRAPLDWKVRAKKFSGPQSPCPILTVTCWFQLDLAITWLCLKMYFYGVTVIGIFKLLWE